ncbi:MAG: UDP-glucose 4-epimerase GalE [Bdellovibrionota bacterium]
MNVLVTGGAGYIGSHACKQLKKHGLNPIVYDNLSRGHEDFVKWGPLIHGDILDTTKVEQTLKQYQIEAVLHFAAFAYVGESVENPTLYYKNNVQGSLSLLEGMLKANVKKIIFSSTCATYGIPEKIPLTEELPQNPINPYGQTKLMIEKILRDYAPAYGLRSVCLRYFNAAGADPESLIGENHEPETHIIPLAIESALKNKVLKIFGSDYSTPDGTCLRDYIHVADLAEAHVLALKYLNTSDKNFDYFNLGNEKAFSVKEIVKAVEEVSNLKVNAEIYPRRSGDPAVLVSDSTKAKNILKWTPEIKDIKEIIRTAYNWHKKNL